MRNQQISVKKQAKILALTRQEQARKKKKEAK